ncbi:MAG: DUF5803 family protein [Methanolinea sp.]|nr:DUF5803 family protein [Methanolinea sp.]
MIQSLAADVAEFRILPNGTAYTASLDLSDATGYEFSEPGFLGEMVPFRPQNVTLAGDCSPCTFTWKGDSAIRFPRGNYTLSFQGPVRDRDFLAVFDRPRRVSVVLPPGFDARNPALGAVSPGAAVSTLPDGGLSISWNATRVAEVRFYEREREELLFLFAQFWVVVALVMLAPFLLTRGNPPRGPRG